MLQTSVLFFCACFSCRRRIQSFVCPVLWFCHRKMLHLFAGRARPAAALPLRAYGAAMAGETAEQPWRTTTAQQTGGTWCTTSHHGACCPIPLPPTLRGAAIRRFGAPVCLSVMWWRASVALAQHLDVQAAQQQPGRHGSAWPTAT